MTNAYSSTGGGASTAVRHRGAASKQMVMTVALVVFIAGCMIFIAKQLFTGEGNHEQVRNLGFHCQDCDHEFVITNIQLREQAPDNAVLEQDRTRSIDQPHCPQCGKKHAGMPMFECLKCGHFFMTVKVNLRTNPDAVIPPPVCPKCGTNQTEFLRNE